MRWFLLGCGVWKGIHPNPCYHLNFHRIWKINSKMSSKTRVGDCKSLECFTLLYSFTNIYSQSKSLTEIRKKRFIFNFMTILDLGMNSIYFILPVCSLRCFAASFFCVFFSLHFPCLTQFLGCILCLSSLGVLVRFK